jgi:hypothetical protein
MAAHLTLKDRTKNLVFHVGEKTHERWLGIKPDMIESIQLDGGELLHAIETLGAPNVKKHVVMYFGDEACRIFFNWY